MSSAFLSPPFLYASSRCHPVAITAPTSARLHLHEHRFHLDICEPLQDPSNLHLRCDPGIGPDLESEHILTQASESRHTANKRLNAALRARRTNCPLMSTRSLPTPTSTCSTTSATNQSLSVARAALARRRQQSLCCSSCPIPRVQVGCLCQFPVLTCIDMYGMY